MNSDKERQGASIISQPHRAYLLFNSLLLLKKRRKDKIQITI